MLIFMDSLEAMSVDELKCVAKHVGTAVSAAKGEIILRLLQKYVNAKHLQDARDIQEASEIEVSEASTSARELRGAYHLTGLILKRFRN